MLKLLKNISSISSTIRKVGETTGVFADAIDVLKKLNSIWNPSEGDQSEIKSEIKENEQND